MNSLPQGGAALESEATVEHDLPQGGTALKNKMIDEHVRNMADFKCLTEREKDVVSCTVQGMTGREAGKSLFVTEKTIKFHSTHIYRKLGVSGAKGMMAAVVRSLIIL